MIKNEKLRKMIRIGAVLALVLSLYFFASEALSYISHQQELKNLQEVLDEVSEEIIDTTGEAKADTSDVMGSIQYYTKLKLQNDDYIGWIYMPKLKINYPVVLAPDNEYYLKRSFYKSYNIYGTIFADYRNVGVYDDAHLIIYGHHMKNKTMFSHLDDLRQKSNYASNKTIEIYAKGVLKKYIIFSVYSVDATKTTFDLPYTGDVQTLISVYTKKALYKTNVDTSGATHILTLVTCTSAVTNGRLVVHAIPYVE